MGAKNGKQTAAKPGLLARLFGQSDSRLAPAQAPAPARRYTGPAKDAAESGRLRAQLQQQIKSLRAKLNPQLLRVAENIARKGPPTTDHDRAQTAVGLFLAQKKDGGDYVAKLKAKLDEQKRKSH